MTQDGTTTGNVFKTEAQEIIVSLKTEKGWSYAQIAQALGRDRSMVSQAARGVRPINNALPALRALQGLAQPPGPGDPSASKGQGLASVQGSGARTSPVVPMVPRRMGRNGMANVRGGLVIEKQGGAHVQTKKTDFLLTQIQQAATKNQWVQIAARYKEITWKDGSKEKHRSVNIYKKGYRAEAMLKRVDKQVQEASGRGETLQPAAALQGMLHQDTYAATSGGGSAGIGEADEVEQYEAELSDAAPR